MNFSHRKKPAYFLVFLLFLIVSGHVSIVHAQTFTTVQNGNWNSATTWSGGLIPDEFLSGDIVNIEHDVNYDIANNLHIETGVLNVRSMLDIGDNNIKMEAAAGIVNIESGLVQIDNGNFLNDVGTVNFSSGAVQICNDNYFNGSTKGTHGTGYIYIDNGNVEDLTASNFSSGISWCSERIMV